MSSESAGKCQLCQASTLFYEFVTFNACGPSACIQVDALNSVYVQLQLSLTHFVFENNLIFSC